MKSLNVIKWVLLAISVVIFVYAVANIVDVDSSALNCYLGWTYALVAVALIATLGFPLAKAFTNKKSLVKLLLLIVGAAVIIGGTYAIAPGGEVAFKSGISPEESKFADLVLYITYLFVGVAVVSLIWTGIRSSLKK